MSVSINNVNTKIIGNIATDDMLANSLFHEDLDTDEIKDRIAGLRRGEWVVQLPSTGFHKQKPEILTLKPLPIPPGHSEGPFDVSPKSKFVRERSRDLHTLNRDSEYINSSAGADFSSSGDGDATPSDTDSDTTGDDGGLKPEQKTLLKNIFDALSGDIKLYDLDKPMTALPNSEYASDLEDQELVEKVAIGQNKVYYIPTKEGEFLADGKSLSPDEGGELGNESPEHHLGVRFSAAYFDQQGFDITLYGDINGGKNKTDTFAEATKQTSGDRDKLIEVEMSPEKKQHVLDDYEALKEAYGDAVWVVESHEEAVTLLEKLSERVDDLPSGHNLRSIEKLNEKLGEPGIRKIHTLNSLRKQIE
ncbi:hypothetical protein DJ68_06070 [Halorubrum sp. C3]|nr:hypothetical protein DJ68_06070 [Halorubrum sp. C3]